LAVSLLLKDKAGPQDTILSMFTTTLQYTV